MAGGGAIVERGARDLEPARTGLGMTERGPSAVRLESMRHHREVALGDFQLIQHLPLATPRHVTATPHHVTHQHPTQPHSATAPPLTPHPHQLTCPNTTRKDQSTDTVHTMDPQPSLRQRADPIKEHMVGLGAEEGGGGHGEGGGCRGRGGIVCRCGRQVCRCGRQRHGAFQARSLCCCDIKGFRPAGARVLCVCVCVCVCLCVCVRARFFLAHAHAHAQAQAQAHTHTHAHALTTHTHTRTETTHIGTQG